MTHLEVENLASDYSEGRLEPSLRAELEAHLVGCGRCRELVGDVRWVMGLCHSVEVLEPAPWLVPRILRATIGQRRPTLRQRLALWARAGLQPRVAYGVAMALFSFSLIVSAAGINLRRLTLEDLNPRTWTYQATRTGHLLYARVEKFCYDLRVVYEIESRARRLRPEPREDQQQEPQEEVPSRPSTDRMRPGGRQFALVRVPWVAGAVRSPSQ